jgi:hypothetical protein
MKFNAGYCFYSVISAVCVLKVVPDQLLTVQQKFATREFLQYNIGLFSSTGVVQSLENLKIENIAFENAMERMEKKLDSDRGSYTFKMTIRYGFGLP